MLPVPEWTASSTSAAISRANSSIASSLMRYARHHLRELGQTIGFDPKASKGPLVERIECIHDFRWYRRTCQPRKVATHLKTVHVIQKKRSRIRWLSVPLHEARSE